MTYNNYNHDDYIARCKVPKPTFEVGDWCTSDFALLYEPIFQVTPEILASNDKYSIGLKHWQPQQGDWCWFWGTNQSIPSLRQFTHVDCECKYHYINSGVGYFCAPFIGTLPPGCDS